VWARNHLVNPVVRAVGHSPAHRLLGRHLVLLSYPGRRTGRRYELPVMTAPAGEDLVVLVADPAAKTWWHDVGPDPTDVSIWTGGREQARTARRLAPEAAGYADALAAYRSAFPRVGVASGLPVVVLTRGSADSAGLA